jgi:hypothetical protein
LYLKKDNNWRLSISQSSLICVSNVLTEKQIMKRTTQLLFVVAAVGSLLIMGAGSVAAQPDSSTTVNQNSSAIVAQGQTVGQGNVNGQLGGLAVTYDSEDSVAIAGQWSSQSNSNSQTGIALSGNYAALTELADDDNGMNGPPV